MRRPGEWVRGAPRWYRWVAGVAVVFAMLLVITAAVAIASWDRLRLSIPALNAGEQDRLAVVRHRFGYRAIQRFARNARRLSIASSLESTWCAIWGLHAPRIW